MKRTMKQLTAFMLALLLLAGQMTSALAATSEGVGLDVAPYAVEGSADRLDFDPYSDYVENEIYVTDEYLHPYPDDHEFVSGDKLRFNIRFELEKSDALYGNWFNSSECTYAIREAYRQGYFWGGKPTSLPQIDETTVFTIPFAGLGNIVGANLPWSYAQRQDGLIQQSSNVAFQWWLDKENEKVCLVFTKNALDGVSGYEALSNLYINVSGELDASALQGENTADFTVGNVDISLPLAAECVPVKSAVMEYDAATGNYVAHYTITLDLNRDVNLSEVALNVLDTRTEGTIIGAPQNVSVTSATGDDVSVTFAAVDGLSTRFDLASSDSILTKGSYTITYSAPLTKTYDELFSQNGSGFNALNYDQKTNTAQVYKGDTPTGNTSSATLTYTAPSQTTALSKEVYQDYTNSSYINGIYEVRDQNGVTEYYATFYVDARIQNEANSLTITDDAGQWLSHINESPVVLYTQAGLVDWINPDALTTPENVSVIYNDNGNVRTFTVSGNPLQPGAYRLMYRMKVKPEAVKEALSSGKDLSIVNTAALTKLDAFPIEDRSDDAAITLPSYTKSAKSYQIITLDDGSKLVQWQIAFRWNFFQKEGDSQIVDTLSGGNYFVSAEYPMTILNNYQQVASITDITKAGDYGVDFAADGSSFTYTLGESGNYNEKTNNIYIITYYTQLEEADESGVIPTQTNSYETKYSFDNTTGGDSGTVVVNTEAEEEPDTPVDPDKPDPDEPTETPIRISPIKAVLSSSFDRASQAFFIKWEVAAELGQLPYERVESFVITDIIPDDMLDYMDITAVDVVVRSADWGPLIPLTENQHYTVEKTSDDRWAVSLNVAAVYETMPNAQWIGANFTTKAQQLPQGMSQCHNNSAELHYTYGDFDITTTCTQGNWYQASKPEKTGWLQNQDVYNSATGEYVYNQDGVGDIVWQIALKDANFLNRGETTAVSVADTLPTIALPSGETVTMMEILENTLRIQSVSHGNSGTKIENFTLQNNGSTFTLTFDVPADWPADSVYILYCCQLTDDYAASLNGDTYVPNVTNTANATWDNYTDHITGTSAMNVVDNRLMKSGTVAVDRSRINYTLSINPRKFDLSADSDVVLVTDALNNTNVTYLQNSFVLKDSAGNVLTRAAAASTSTYHLKFSSDGSSFQLEVPDNTSLVLTYSVEPTIEVGHETGSIGNTAQTAGITKYHQINSFRADISSAGASTAVLLDGQRGVVVFKNDSETDMPLDGAEFTIYKVNSDLTETATAKTGVSAGGRILFRFTATEEGLGFDQVYCLRETKAPAGYAKSDEAWYFYFAQADKNGDEITPSTETQAILDALAAKDIPVTADAASKTYTFTAKNTPVTTADFTFTKVDENGVALDGAVFALVDSEGAAVAAKENTETGVFTYEGLTVGAYVLTEISAPEGYELPENASWRVTVAEDGTITVTGEGFNTADNTITNTKTPEPEPVTATFSFKKVDENGAALDGASFTLTNANSETVHAKADTATGVFTYEALPVGTYTLIETAAPEGYDLPANTSWTVTVAEDGTVSVTGEGFNTTDSTITNTKTPEPEPVTATFSFTKVDENGAALEGASFTLTNAEGTSIPAKADTAIGVFTYEALPVGTYTLTETAAPEGYELPANTSWTVTVAEDGTITVTGEGFNTTDSTITNTKTPEPEPITATFTFTKVDENGAALDGAVFTLTNANSETIPVKADTATGVFTYEGLTVGAYVLTEISAPEGYDLPANTSWTVTVADDGTITVTGEGFNTTDSTITNTKTPEPEPVTATFSFKKVDENGAALDGASFTLTNANSETVPAKADTATGVFTYEGLTVGVYVLTEISAPEGYDLPANTSWTVTVADDGTITVTGEGFITTDNTITNTKTPEPEPVTATFSFKKVDENGAALDGAVFTLTNTNGETIPAKADTATGVFTYEALPAGTYTLTETAAPEGYDLPANTSWTVTVADDGTITVTGEGFNTTDNTITNTKTPEPEPVTATFTFTKVDENGAALEGASFTLTNAEGTSIPAKADTATGVFTYEALPVGTYTLTETAAPEGYDLPANTSWTVTVAENGTITVTGEGFNTADNTITNTKTPEPEPVTATFSFTKVDENGVALDGAVFTLTNANSETIPAKADTAIGEFTYEALPAGTYTLTETAAPEGYELPANTSWTVTVAEDGTVSVTGEGFNTTDSTITNVKTPEPEPVTATFTFTKVDENGAALDGAVFTLTNANSETVPAKADTAIGVFTYEALPVGSYTLTETAAPEGYDLPANTSWTVTVAEDGTITVTGEGFNTTDSTITNVKTPEPEPVTATFTFTKVDENGAALDGASFTLTNAEGTSIPAKADTATGVFTYEALPVGSYTLTETAAPEGYDLPANTIWTVTVAEDGTVSVTGEGFNTTDSTITNTKTPEPEPITATFTFTKVDENGVTLDGAVFTLTNANSETIPAKADTAIGVFTYEALPVGSYTLTETAAPEGYDLPANTIWTVTVADDGTITVTGEGFNTAENTITNTKTPEPEPVTATFSFTKVDENGAALDGAVFTLTNTNSETIPAKADTAIGVFTYEALPVGTYTLTETAAPEGYDLPANTTWTVTVAEDGTITVTGEGFNTADNTITNTKTPEPEPVTATFTFTKVDENGAALDGASFTLTNANSETVPAKANTATGVFTYEALPVGSYTLTETAAPEGYDLPANTTWTVTVAEDGTITVTGEGFNTADNTITNVKTPEPEPVTATFSFTKVDENGVALDGAVFTLTNANSETIPAKADTAIGVFTYEALPVGSYTLTETAAPEGYDLPANTSWTVTVADDGTITVTGEGFNTTDSTITNTKTPEPEPVTATFSFKKVDENGAALDGATFTLTNANSETIPAKADTAIGVFTYEALPVGSYTLTETAAPEGYDLPANTSWTVTVAEDGTVSVTGEGFNTTDSTITNVKTPEPEPVTATFTFTKVDENGVALDGAVFTLTNANSETIPAKADTAIGVFTYEALPAGTYTLTETAAPEGYDLPANTSWTVTVAEDGTITVTGEGFNTADNTITNTKTPEPEPVTATFTFTKVDENGIALLGATFTLTNADGQQIFPKAGEPAAVFTYVNLPVGVYTLEETKAPAGYDLPENAVWTVTVAEDGTVSVTGDCFNTENNTIVNARTRFSLSLTKVDGANSGKKLKGARFSLSGTDYKQIQTTGADGRVTFTGLLPGRYTLLEEKAPDGYLRSSTYQWKVTVYASGRIDVGAKQDVKNTLTIVNHKEGDIAQTGPVTWPKTLMLLLGGALYVTGLLLILPAMYKKRTRHED